MRKKADIHERRTAIHLLRGGRRPAEVAQEVGRSLAWVYKWRHRFFEEQDWTDLADRSRAPRRCPTQLGEDIRRAIRQARSELEAAATEPGALGYIGAPAVQARLRHQSVSPLPSISSIERVLAAAGMTHPRPAEAKASVAYPHLEPTAPHQLVQVDIVTRFLPGGTQVACFNALDVISHYPTGQQYVSRRSTDATNFLIHLWQTLGIPDYTQMDNESCFSGGFSHPGVLGKVVRLGLFVGTELVFSPIRHPESNGSVERFHQDYLQHLWDKLDLPDLTTLQHHSPSFFETYRHSEHIATLQGRCPAQVQWEQPGQPWPVTGALPQPLPLTAGQVHFMRRVDPAHQITLLNLTWAVPKAHPDQGVWATLTLSRQDAKLRIYDAAPDAARRTCLAEHPFPLTEPVQPVQPEFQRPIPVDPAWFSLATGLFRVALKIPLAAWLSTMS